ncbi:cellulose synthase operon protein YhjQ [Dyella solisilvae]|uniref:Cellulose synthase operon protein YhjQ n=1 Tax=Dyella solisilvae TaxID=1920168 RepID=A0A370KBV0_9GAMM|nr:cellulose biosynthesis protein BcsQ [Dyella solisilvae]RDI99560.1 cellulose synthase operon protein YhjQ [Dyella solisilvae]
MKTIAILSSVGGAGRTMLTAALAGLLAVRKHPVLAVECDPANVLGLYGGASDPPRRGLASYVTAEGDGGDAALEGEDGVLWLPWGGAGDDGRGPDAAQAAAIDSILHGQRFWLRDLLSRVDLPANGVVLVDTAAWPSIHASQAIDAAHLVLVVVPPQPLACATLPRLRAELAARNKATLYVANAVSPALQLHTDILVLLRNLLGATLSPYRIHADAGVPEALARNENFCVSAPHSQAAHDMQGLASWLSSWATSEARRTVAAAGGAS